MNRRQLLKTILCSAIIPILPAVSFADQSDDAARQIVKSTIHTLSRSAMTAEIIAQEDISIFRTLLEVANPNSFNAKVYRLADEKFFVFARE